MSQHGDWTFLYDHKEETTTRYVSFIGEEGRYDIAIIKTKNFYGKSLVLNILTHRMAILGQKDLDEPGYLEEAFNMTEEEANELREFLRLSI
ncbi:MULTISPECIES: DUF3055 domain-containing protein [Aneurinibacillus]|uniref:DUF3055 domain-containing protein n=1 Tax=Aneurinibacillus thermoaerophilus TaxID=143495 RepID=A0A1G8BYV4_ANETH|nr:MULTISPECIES: DUF3055 domain-containing protein [Aneurinibacillus]AMA71975.1 cytosolic protein [Aneurinibacillus sp. XH2]MED0679253.1 DUF3055 domain-containing protein [Aneurinibacillus thermoaerophilus]MED0737139.1 DUF3055 domain-containing protein [Aneurinibacillus thermoaerophilus]MED0764808.1 DUF3055 domain-containing protein [Aneurinibacillus thermoaerophilus]QYY42257.1 DUF3055 domain-containing protein [Aneurinibacillus thermoaerophilus]